MKADAEEFKRPSSNPSHINAFMNNRKCAHCGLVNFPTADECRRCGASLHTGAAGTEPAAATDDFADDGSSPPPPRSLARRVAVAVVVANFLLLLCYISLLETSTPVTYDEKMLVHRAIDLIEQRGFAGDAFLLRRLASYRTTDNWWNRWLGHQDAYAATNFPFQVVTLYPEFFKYPIDDTERAAILIHEARHLAGAGEARAFAGVWRDKARLGWTKEHYGQTRVWRNVNEFTLKYAPQIPRCGGPEDRSDCAELGPPPSPPPPPPPVIH